MRSYGVNCHPAKVTFSKVAETRAAYRFAESPPSVQYVGVNFYRAMLCIRGTSRGPVSVRLSVSVTSRCSIETAERIVLGFGM